MNQSTRHAQDPSRSAEQIAEAALARLLSRPGAADPEWLAKDCIGILRTPLQESGNPSVIVLQQGQFQDIWDELQQCRQEHGAT